MQYTPAVPTYRNQHINKVIEHHPFGKRKHELIGINYPQIEHAIINKINYFNLIHV